MAVEIFINKLITQNRMVQFFIIKRLILVNDVLNEEFLSIFTLDERFLNLRTNLATLYDFYVF